MNHTNSPPVRNMAAYLAPGHSDRPLPPQPAYHDERIQHDSDYRQYPAQNQPNPQTYYPPYLPPKPAEYATTSQSSIAASSSSLPASATGVPPSTLDIADFEGWDKPMLSLSRFRSRTVQFILVLVLFCVNMSTEIEYLDHDAPEVFNVARELEIAPDAKRQHFFTFVTFFAILATSFNLLAIALVRCVRPQKLPKSRIVGEIVMDIMATLFLAIGSTLLLSPGSISNPTLSVSNDLRNYACVLSSWQDYEDISDSNAHFVNYPAICRRSWVSVVFGYLSLATFAITIVGGIHRARRLKLLMVANYSNSTSGQV